MSFKKILGGYFIYCQQCKNDGNCILKHHEYMGVASQGRVDETPYHGHEDLAWHGTAFQRRSSRATCAGRISATNSFFYPLACECGTVVSSLTLSGAICQKFKPNGKYKMREVLAKALIVVRKQESPQLFYDEFDDILTKEEQIRLDELCPPDKTYQAAMEQ